MVIIDAGHGGMDIGGGSNKYWLEKDLNLKISLYQYDRLKSLGIPVALTRDSDVTMYKTERINKINSIKKGGVNDILISNHINIDFSNFDGAEIIYSKNRKDTLPRLIATNLSDAGQNLSANGIYQRINASGYDYYYIIRDTQNYESIIVEYGFADSLGNDINLLLYNYLDLAEAVVKSICEYLGYKYNVDTFNYVVKENDTLYKIAKSYETDVETLKKINNLKSDTIYIGQTLLVPAYIKTIKTISYIVKSGDSLYKISSLFNESIEKIKAANNKQNNIIYVGEVLQIPISNNLSTYSVKAGDSLYKIAMKYNITVPYIMAINNLKTDNIYIGQTILV